MYKSIRAIYIRQLLLCILFLAPAVSYAQDGSDKVWTLTECVDHAVTHNYEMQQFGLQKDKAAIMVNSSRNLFLPAVDGKVRNVYNWGLFIDPATNILTTQSNEIYSGGLEAEWGIFNGGLNYYTIKQNQELFNASVANQQVKGNQIILLVISAYYQMLYAREQLKIAGEQKAQIQKQYDLIQGMVGGGILHKRELLTMESELALRDVAITDARNIYLRSDLLLRQTMGMTQREPLNIDTTIVVSVPESLSAINYDSICAKAQYALPEIDAAKSLLNASRYRMKMNQSYLYPAFSISAGIITKSSSLIQLEQNDQFRNNLSEYIAFNLTLPVFNRFLNRNNVAVSRIDISIQENEVKRRSQEVEQRVQIAYLDLMAAHTKYWAILKQVEALKSQNILAEKSYAAGIVNQTEFSYTNNLYTNAQIQFLQAKYDYLYKKEVLDFYEGKGSCAR